MIFAAVTDNELSGVAPPTMPVNVTVPVLPKIVSACAPFSVVLNEILFTVLELEIVLGPVNKTLLGNVIAAPLTVIFPPT